MDRTQARRGTRSGDEAIGCRPGAGARGTRARARMQQPPRAGETQTEAMAWSGNEITTRGWTVNEIPSYTPGVLRSRLIGLVRPRFAYSPFQGDDFQKLSTAVNSRTSKSLTSHRKGGARRLPQAVERRRRRNAAARRGVHHIRHDSMSKLPCGPAAPFLQLRTTTDVAGTLCSMAAGLTSCKRRRRVRTCSARPPHRTSNSGCRQQSLGAAMRSAMNLKLLIADGAVAGCA
jgi:hypothetical protein